MADLAQDNTSEIVSLRSLFQETYADNIASGEYDERDLQKLADDDNYATKFIRPNYKPADRAALIHDSLKWRKEFCIRDVTADSIPSILWEQNAMYFHKTDKDGSSLLWVEVKKYRKDLNLLTESKRLFAYLMETFYEENPTAKLVILFDMSSTGLSNYDLDLIRFIINCFKCYFPGILSYLLIYDAPWLFNAIWKIIKSWLRADEVAFIKFAKKATVQEYINRDNLFDHMGGPCVRENSDGVDGVGNVSSKSDKKKKVTFAEIEAIEDGDMTDSGGDHRAHNWDVLKDKPPDADLEDFTTIGDILAISPSEDLEFATDEASHDLSAVITLCACSSRNIAFKVKTTSPDKFRVRPSIGIVRPDTTVRINIAVLPGLPRSINKDRFLLLVVEVPDDQTSLSEIWKTVDKTTVLEHKLCCSLASVPPTPTDPPPVIYGDSHHLTSAHNYKQLHMQIEAMAENQRRINNKLSMAVTLLCVILALLCYCCTHLVRYTSSDDEQCTKTRHL